jgi:hypothetical protein
MDEEQATFKVTDRRLFNADGSPRELIPEEKAVANTKTAAIDPPGNTKAEAVAEAVVTPIQGEAVVTPQETSDEVSDPGDEEFTEADIPDARDPASFVSLAMSIATNAASALGMMEHPVTHKREVDLELGKHWIDVLGMLQKKTSGNLSGPEAQLLEGWLADLRMQFVSLSGSPAHKEPTTYTGRDIIGGK